MKFIVVMLSFALGLVVVIWYRSNPDTAPGSCPWSRQPPGGLSPAEVPQFVCITFDDNFGLSGHAPTGGVRGIVDFCAGKNNPTGGTDVFAGTPIRCTFFHTALYMADPKQQVHGGRTGEDWTGGNRAAWIAARAAGHEVADHTVTHMNGGSQPLGVTDQNRPRNWSVAEWAAEIGACRDILCDPASGIGIKRSQVGGFRAPYLSFNDELFGALRQLDFTYDSSVVCSLGEGKDGKRCSWPYTLDHGSPDADEMMDHGGKAPPIGSHPGLWELPPSALVIPDDDEAEQLGLPRGIRGRFTQAPALDYSMLITAGMTGAQMKAVLAHNLDLHLAGNHAPLVFVAHAHLYAFTSAKENPDTPSLAIRDERWQALSGFIEYARSKPQVRIVAAEDVVKWMREAGALK